MTEKISQIRVMTGQEVLRRWRIIGRLMEGQLAVYGVGLVTIGRAWMSIEV